VDVREHVEEISGERLDAVDGLDFSVSAQQSGDGSWELELVTRDGSAAEPSRRKFTGPLCSAVMDAAVVAIAMSIQSNAPRSKTEETELASEPPPKRNPAAPPLPGPVSSKRPGKPAPMPARIEFIAGAALLVDSSSLPDASAGALIDLALRRGTLRFGFEGSILPASQIDLEGGALGEFELMALAGLVCLDRRLEGFALLGCGGYELGEMSGMGVGVTTPHERSRLWQAVRAELGGALALEPWLRALLRAGVAVPVTRSEFQVDGTTVHDTAGLTLRLSLGLEVGL